MRLRGAAEAQLGLGSVVQGSARALHFITGLSASLKKTRALLAAVQLATAQAYGPVCRPLLARAQPLNGVRRSCMEGAAQRQMGRFRSPRKRIFCGRL